MQKLWLERRERGGVAKYDRRQPTNQSASTCSKCPRNIYNNRVGCSHSSRDVTNQPTTSPNQDSLLLILKKVITTTGTCDVRGGGRGRKRVLPPPSAPHRTAHSTLHSTAYVICNKKYHEPSTTGRYVFVCVCVCRKRVLPPPLLAQPSAQHSTAYSSPHPSRIPACPTEPRKTCGSGRQGAPCPCPPAPGWRWSRTRESRGASAAAGCGEASGCYGRGKRARRRRYHRHPAARASFPRR